MEVDQFPANAWGLYDMHGNVWEWTCSVYGENYGGVKREYASKDHAGLRVLRGGSWGSVPWLLRAASRHWYVPDLRNFNWGFRLARNL